MIIHALQTVLHLNTKYLSDVQIPRICIQSRLLYTLKSEKSRQNNAKQTHFLGFKYIGNTNVFFYVKNHKKIGVLSANHV